MYNFFYPENDEKFPLPDFETVDAALEYWRDKRWTWEEIRPQSAGDYAAFVNPSGVIVVLREARSGRMEEHQ